MTHTWSEEKKNVLLCNSYLITDEQLLHFDLAHSIKQRKNIHPFMYYFAGKA